VNKNTVNLIAKLYEIEETRGTNAKKAILEKYKNDGAFTETLRWYFDNLIVTGLKEKKLQKQIKLEAVDSVDWKDWGLMDMLEYLNENNTGKDLDAAIIQAFANQYDKKTATAILRIAAKSWDKGLGIGRTTCNAVYGENFIPVHEVMLCKNYFDDPDYFVGESFAIQAKLDGFRMTIFKKGNLVKVLSRSGKDQTGNFPLIEEDVRTAFAGMDVVLDGERMPLGFMEMDSKQQYKLVSNSTKKGGSNDVCLAVYDYMPLKDWNSRNCKMVYSERYTQYHAALTTKPGVQKYTYLFALPALYIGDDISQIEKWLNWAKENEKEGVIVKILNAGYEWDRTMACAKVKTFSDIDLKIVDFQEGKGKHKNRLGAILCEYKGNIVRCGSGFSDEMRDKIWNNRKKYLGKIAEIVYFEESQNKSGEVSLRFPVFKCIKDGN